MCLFRVPTLAAYCLSLALVALASASAAPAQQFRVETTPVEVADTTPVAAFGPGPASSPVVRCGTFTCSEANAGTSASCSVVRADAVTCFGFFTVLYGKGWSRFAQPGGRADATGTVYATWCNDAGWGCGSFNPVAPASCSWLGSPIGRSECANPFSGGAVSLAWTGLVPGECVRFSYSAGVVSGVRPVLAGAVVLNLVEYVEATHGSSVPEITVCV